MGKVKYVLILDEETQGLIINSLLALREQKLKEGMDIGFISDAIVEVCNAPKKKNMFKGESYAR